MEFVLSIVSVGAQHCDSGLQMGKLRPRELMQGAQGHRAVCAGARLTLLFTCQGLAYTFCRVDEGLPGTTGTSGRTLSWGPQFLQLLNREQKPGAPRSHFPALWLGGGGFALWFFEAGSYCVAQAGLRLEAVLPPQPS